MIDYLSAEGIKMCPITYDSESYSRCAVEVLHDIVPHLAKGIPSMKVPIMEPLSFPSIGSDRDLGILKVKFIFKNFNIFGFTNSTPIDYKIDLNQLALEAKFHVPHLTFSGDYNIKGIIFAVPLGGSGVFEGNVRKNPIHQYLQSCSI